MSEPLFDMSREYDEMLNQGLALSGEGKEYFIEGRLGELKRTLPEGFSPKKILDFGCGIGTASECLAKVFPNALVIGSDTSEEALKYGAENVKSSRVKFMSLESLQNETEFDLCYTSGVFHHIEPARRIESLQWISDRLKEGGYFSFFENNPWNPGTRAVMNRIPFDRDAKTLAPPEAEMLLQEQSLFQIEAKRFLFYFPRFLAWFRPLERSLAKIPLGAQYYLLAQKVKGRAA